MLPQGDPDSQSGFTQLTFLANAFPMFSVKTCDPAYASKKPAGPCVHPLPDYYQTNHLQMEEIIFSQDRKNKRPFVQRKITSVSVPTMYFQPPPSVFMAEPYIEGSSLINFCYSKYLDQKFINKTPKSI